jgi:hypothetical protein
MTVDAVELAHSLWEISLRCFDHKMIMVVRQPVGVAQPVKAVNDPAEDLQEGFAVPSLVKDVFARVAARGHMGPELKSLRAVLRAMGMQLTVRPLRKRVA